MPEFEVTICRTIIQTLKITLKAANEDVAFDTAESLISQDDWVAKQEWELESDQCEVESIDEL